MGQAQVINIERSKEGKVCNGKECKGKVRELTEFYTKGKNKDGSPRYDHICKSCKAAKSKKRRQQHKKASKQAKQNIKIDIRSCTFIEIEDQDFVKEDLEKSLKASAYSLIFD